MYGENHVVSMTPLPWNIPWIF